MIDPAKRVLEIADRFEPKIRRALADAFESLRGRFTERQILEALQSRGIDGVMGLLGGLEGQFGGVRDQLEAAVTESGRFWIEAIPVGAVLDPVFRFSLVNPETASFVRDYSLNLIREIAGNTREAVRQGLAADIVSGRNPRDTARTFRENLGLTARQELAVRNYRRALETGSTDALRRALRDKRSDAKVMRAIESGKALPPDVIDSLVNRYRKRYIKYRSEVIARTESLRAATVGQRAAVKQAMAQRAVDQNRLRRFWVFTTDTRTRPDHRLIPGMNPDGVGLDEPYQTPQGPLMYPRDPNGRGSNTIQCRCAERYALLNPDGTFAGPKPRGYGPELVAPPYGPKSSRSKLLGPARVKKPSKAKKPAAKKPAAKKPAPPAPPAKKPKTTAELKAEFERLTEQVARGEYGNLDDALKAQSAARVAWARTLDKNALAAAKVQVYRDMVHASEGIDLNTAFFQRQFKQASGWVPFDVLEEMRLQGYRVNIINKAATSLKNPKGFRAFALGRDSYLAFDSSGVDHAHEFGHLLDTFFSDGKLGKGRWTNKRFVGSNSGYKEIFHKLRSDVKGTFPNSDGEFWCGPWIENYEGRIYVDQSTGAVANGLEFWSKNCERYSQYRLLRDEGFDIMLQRAWDKVSTLASSDMSGHAKLLRADLTTLESMGREQWAAGMSSWNKVRDRYGETAKMFEDLFDKGFLTSAS